MKAAIAALVLILLATSCQAEGIFMIQESSGIGYYAYAINISGNQTTIWTDETTIEFLDPQENTVFQGVE